MALACLAGAACGESGAPGVGSAALVAVLSAMPSELAPNLADAEMTLAVDVAGRDVRMGSLGGVPVVLAMTGIGTANAAAVSSAVLDAFPVTGVIVSGVAHLAAHRGRQRDRDLDHPPMEASSPPTVAGWRRRARSRSRAAWGFRAAARRRRERRARRSASTTIRRSSSAVWATPATRSAARLSPV
ncbi:MAG: hypothetical protein IPK07_31850 [Deltaproteobacteria bacterium]|nr:hypothetical protein [Deltaproteobacteria bacterium]